MQGDLIQFALTCGLFLGGAVTVWVALNADMLPPWVISCWQKGYLAASGLCLAAALVSFLLQPALYQQRYIAKLLSLTGGHDLVIMTVNGLLLPFGSETVVWLLLPVFVIPYILKRKYRRIDA